MIRGWHMADLSDLATQIIGLTKVVSDAKEAIAGKPISVSVIPGFTPSIPSVQNLTGTLGSGLAGSIIQPIAAALTPLITAVQISVKYVVTRDGMQVAATEFSTNPPLPSTGTHPLDIEFLLAPPIGEDIGRTKPAKYVIEVHIEVSLDGHSAGTGANPLKIPVLVPAIGIPAVLLLAQHTKSDPNFPGDVLCMVRPASPLVSLDKVVSTLNTLADTLSTVKDLLGLAGAVNPFDALDTMLNVVQRASVVYFAVGGAPDFNEFGGWDVLGFGGFDDEASSAFMIGATGTRARVWSSEDFSDSDWHEHSTFEVQDLGTTLGLPVQLGFGFFINESFGDWDTDAGDSMNDEIESARFL